MQTYAGSCLRGLIVGQICRPPLKPGDEWTVRGDDIYAWMIVDNGKLVGGHSIQVMRSKMSLATAVTRGRQNLHVIAKVPS